MIIAFRGARDLADTQVAMAFGASVQPFTKMTPSVNTTMINSAGLFMIPLIKSGKVIVISFSSPLFSMHIQKSTVLIEFR